MLMDRPAGRQQRLRTAAWVRVRPVGGSWKLGLCARTRAH